MRILYIMPGVVAKEGGHGAQELERRRGILQQWASSDCEVAISDLEEGPYSIESSAEEYLCVPGLLKRVKKAQDEGFQAVIDGCYTDPGVHACREIVRIPVLGPGECSLLVAAAISHRFSIVTALEGLVRPLERLAKSVGLWEKTASVRHAHIPVLELASDAEASYRRVRETCRECLDKDGADTLALGCMSMAFLGVSDRLQQELGVPVVNPALVTLKFAEMLVAANLTSSSVAYPPPPKDLPL
jgi:allantoin racemase